ncbi:MAG: hypothetical protein ACTSWX_03790 [Promethearchaeota archaeon]
MTQLCFTLCSLVFFEPTDKKTIKIIRTLRAFLIRLPKISRSSSPL